MKYAESAQSCWPTMIWKAWSARWPCSLLEHMLKLHQ